MFDRELSAKDGKIVALLERDFFAGNPLRIEVELEGSRPEPTVLALGCRAGPALKAWNLIHEMGHFAEIDDRRMTMPGWGLKFPEQWVFDRMCVEPTTWHGTRRECRVIAYQRTIMARYGIHETPYESVESLRYMADFCYVPLWRASTDKWPGDEKVLEFLATYVESLASEYTFERFRAEWDRKCKVLTKRIARRQRMVRRAEAA